MDSGISFCVTATPSLNQLRQPWQYAKWKALYNKELKNYEFLRLWKSIKTRLFITRYSDSKPLDKDNYHGGCKPLIDVIKEKGLIWDDSEKWCDIQFEPQQRSPKYVKLYRTRTEIIIRKEV